MFEIIYYFEQAYGWDIYEVKIKISEEECIHVKIRCNTQPEPTPSRTCDILFITHLKTEETVDSHINFNKVARQPWDETQFVRYEKSVEDLDE